MAKDELRKAIINKEIDRQTDIVCKKYKITADQVDVFIEDVDWECRVALSRKQKLSEFVVILPTPTP